MVGKKKTCTRCKKEKLVDEFWKSTTRGDGYQSHCKNCKRIGNRSWERRNPEKVAAKEKRLRIKRDYNLTIDEYESLLNQPCAICGNKAKVLDHCHKTTHPRAALCHNCNRAIGLLKDSPEILRKAVDYIENWSLIHGNTTIK